MRRPPPFLVALVAGLAASSSYRNFPTSKEALEKLLGEILDRLDRIEKGSFLLGVVSFGPTILIGDVRVTVTNGVGNARNLNFTNVRNGAVYTINL